MKTIEIIEAEKTVQKNNILYKVSMGVLASCFLMLAFIVYKLFAPIEVIKPNYQPYKAITKVVYPGDKFIYEVDACKYVDAESSVTKRFVSDVVYTLPAEINNVPKGCKKTRVPIIVPDSLKPGIWHMEMGIQYKINPFRTKSYYFKTEEFQVATLEGTVK